MKIRLFTIPNMLTLGNLICGASATVALLSHGNYELAFWLVVASAIFDFFDGFAARLLKSTSAIGVQLDSLADMVSFGLVPAVAMFCWYGDANQMTQLSENIVNIGAYLTFIIVAFSALRLAKFNIDDTQHTEFCGLPTPANGLFCLSLAMLAAGGEFALSKEVILIISVVMATLLISPIRMFALKFKGFGWRGNEIRYSFIALCVALIALFTKFAIPAIIMLYVVISTLRWAINIKNK
ncbi:MAG: CDP-alcohol phosphatidyltransferase family protein [Alistipes sp.]|nr:CDP-alcohol phosphatidyltransferase family protein [Alistipes sp.]